MASTIYVNGVTLSDAAEWNNWDTAAYAALTGASGTNTITATGPANLTSVATNPPLWFIPAATNTGATTINITPSGGAALGAKNLFSGGAACVGGEIVIGVPAGIVYDGTQYQILGSSGQRRLSFTASLTGCTAGVTGTAYYSITNGVVQLDLPVLIGTSNTTACTITGIPAAIQATSTKEFAVVVQDNSVAILGAFNFPSGGTINLAQGLNVSGTFTGSGTKGLPAGASISYTVR